MSECEDETGPSEPNAGAYIKTETRTGPPLSYVAEKFRGSLESIHFLYWLMKRDIPEDLPVPQGNFPPNYHTQGALLDQCWQAFRYSLIGYLALNNLLGIDTSQEHINRLLMLPSEEFEKWLEGIDREGLTSLE